MTRWLRAPLLLAAIGTACRSTSDLADSDAAFPPPGVRDATIPEPRPVECNGVPCTAAENTPLGERPCCLESGGCGSTSRALTTAACLAHDAPGGVSLACAPLALPGVPVLQGCCDPSGTCGVYDRFGAFGCIPGEHFGLAPRRCVPDAVACRAIVEIACDGPEDCGAGEECCGRWQSDVYDRFACFPSCSTISEPEGGVWFEICHANAECSRPTDRCTADAALPPFLGRCYSSGEAIPPATPVSGAVTCGDLVCGSGEKCCLRDPGEPDCTRQERSCTCSDDAVEDAAIPPQLDGGETSRDASVDATGD